MLNKSQSIASLERLARRIPALKAKGGISNPDFKQWKEEVETAMKRLFPEKRDASVDLLQSIQRAVISTSNMYFGPTEERFWKAMDNARAVLESMVADIRNADDALVDISAHVMKKAGTKRFRVALSFPGEHRTFVSKVADLLTRSIGREHVFYDKYYEAELARPNLDTYLQNIYRQASDLIVIFLCADYERKEWCGLEWRAIRDLLKRKQESAIMPFRFDETEIPGLFSIDGYISIEKRSPEQIGGLILQRLGCESAAVSQTPGETRDIPHKHTTTPNMPTTERELLSACAKDGELRILHADFFGSWVRAGSQDFLDKKDPAFQATYFEAFESLKKRGFVRHEDGMLYRLTGSGFAIARNITAPLHPESSESLKTITFGQIQDVTTPGSQNLSISIPFAVVDSLLLGQPEQDSSSKHHRLIVSISDLRQHTWDFDAKDLVKVLFEYGKRHIADLIKNDSLPSENTITMPMITSATHPDKCPLDPSRISDPDKAGFEVEVARPQIGFKS